MGSGSNDLGRTVQFYSTKKTTALLLPTCSHICWPKSNHFPISRLHKKETLIQLQQKKKTFPNSWPFFDYSPCLSSVTCEAGASVSYWRGCTRRAHGSEENGIFSFWDKSPRSPLQPVPPLYPAHACVLRVFECTHTPHKPVPSVAFSHLSAAGEQTSGQERMSRLETGDRWDKGNLGWNRFCSCGGVICVFTV